MMKFDKEFREAHPETIGETDKVFDMQNYTEWLEEKVVKQNALLAGVSVPLPEKLDWEALRMKYFNECVDNGGLGILKKNNLAPHDLFEWFKRNI